MSEVVRRAGVARATFYLHYDDLDALAVDACSDVLREAVDAVHASAWPADPDTPPTVIAGLFTALAERREVYRGLLRPGGGGALGERLHRELAERSRAERRRRLGGRPDDNAVASAVASVFTGMLADWLHGTVSGAPAEAARDVWRMIVAIHRTADG